jgi:hypothetical protein
MSHPLTLNLLWFLPIGVALISRRRAVSHLWRNTGIGFGLVVSPASLGLYSLYYVGPIAAVLGMIGLVLALIHGPPGYKLALSLGLYPPNTIVTGVGALPMYLLNALIWSGVYGAVGWLVDRWRRRQPAVKANAV